MIGYAQRVQHGAEKILVLVGDAGDEAVLNVGADHRCKDKTGYIAITVVKCDDEQPVATRLEPRFVQQRSQLGLKELICGKRRAVVSIVKSVGRDDCKSRQGVIGQVSLKMGEIRNV